MQHSLFVHFPIDGYLDFFCLLTIMNRTVVKIFVHIFLVDVCTNFFWVYSKKGVELLSYTIGCQMDSACYSIPILYSLFILMEQKRVHETDRHSYGHQIYDEQITEIQWEKGDLFNK